MTYYSHNWYTYPRYRPSKEHGNADGMSRLQIRDIQFEDTEEPDEIQNILKI